MQETQQKFCKQYRIKGYRCRSKIRKRKCIYIIRGWSGEAYLKIGKDEVNGKWDDCVKGKAMASVAEGSVEGKFEIYGLEIDVEGTGYALGAGAEFKGGVENNKFNLKASAALLFGVGASVSIGLAD